MEKDPPVSWTFLEENWSDRWPVEPGWPGLFLEIDGQEIDFLGAVFQQKKQKSHLAEGWTERSATAHLPGGRILNVHSKQFSCLSEEGSSALRFAVTPLNFSGKIGFRPFLDFSEKCREKEENAPFFVEIARESDSDSAGILLETADGQQRLAASFRFTVYQDGEEIDFSATPFSEQIGVAGLSVKAEMEPLQETVLFRFDTFFLEKKRPRSRLLEQATIGVNRLFVRGFQQLLQEQSLGWGQVWAASELSGFIISKAAQPVFLNIWRLLNDWQAADFFSKKGEGFSHDEAAALRFLCEKSGTAFLRKTLIDRHLRSAKAMESPAFGHVVGEYLRRTGFPKNFLEKGLETLITACRFGFESGGKLPAVLLEKCVENLALAIAAAKKQDPETWRSLMIRFRFEEKREPRRWLERLREAR